ncbi:MAG: Ribosomal RNA small subunit methyltransferase I [Candidatus Magasanikbacteria bacterium GW2011_GWA2_56_11]|uniref:Ribosomal RNA small subunit methyltransferase I n=1 Tax=Candidatus Magasanikbacteria bacterium GW2011_GWA2_56_11 TaxID=1619044 RepID=A0A0G1YFQ0_9BACT|nr:MAG: Ribosomal RNA small subunit methyltransferase I [Candidatus Magasanikbacteria bacterium GW2011_GWA2_56_11]
MPYGTLYIVATPIGNLGDITARALETLRSADIILCEDTRVTRKLLTHFSIERPTKSYHQHSSERVVGEIRALLAGGSNLALVTDAGTPGISDPGSWLVSRLTEGDNVPVVPIPGPSAVAAALSVSGFPADKFLFLGFPPHKKGRTAFFREVAEARHTTVFYESGHRIKKALGELSVALNARRRLCVCRELTKKFESIYRGAAGDIARRDISEKGEFVVVVAGNGGTSDGMVADQTAVENL